MQRAEAHFSVRCLSELGLMPTPRTSREQPAEMATQNRSTDAATGAPGGHRSLAALPDTDSHRPLQPLLPIPEKHQP